MVIKSEEQIRDSASSVKEPVYTGSEPLPNGAVLVDKETGIVTTQEEIDAYNITRSILRKCVDVSRIQYKDYKTYFVINIDGTYKWICRFYLNSKKFIAFPAPADGVRNEEKIEIQSLDDIFSYSDKLIESLKKVMKE